MRNLAVYLVLLVVATAAASAIGIAGVEHRAAAREPLVPVDGAADPVAKYILSIARHMREAGMAAEAHVLAELVAQHRYGEALRLILYYFGEPLGNDTGMDTGYTQLPVLVEWSSIREEAAVDGDAARPRIVIGRLEDKLMEDIYGGGARGSSSGTGEPRREIGGLGRKHPVYPGRPPLHPGLIDKLEPQYSTPVKWSGQELNATAGIVRGGPTPLPYSGPGDTRPTPVKRGWG